MGSREWTTASGTSPTESRCAEHDARSDHHTDTAIVEREKAVCYSTMYCTLSEKWIPLCAKKTGGWSLNYMGVLFARKSGDM